MRIETDCLEGACATCKGLCTQGEYYLDDYSDEALSDEEAARRDDLEILTDCRPLPFDADGNLPDNQFNGH